MPREIWLGPILNRNRERLVARCREMLGQGRGHEFVYLAATKPLMDSVVSSLLGGEVPGIFDQLNVYLLSGFSRRIFAQARFADTNEPLPFFSPIDTDLRPVQRPLFSRLLARLSEGNSVRSFGQLARSDGVVASMAGLIAEIQRAGKTAGEFREIIARREALDAESKPRPDAREAQLPAGATDAERAEAARIAAIDYDRDTATLYDHYERILEDHRLTDTSRDYLRALAVLRGEFLGRPVRVPFIEQTKLVVVDGFFDILPVHSELLTLLIRRVPDAIVNLNYDPRNPSAFTAFRDVVGRFGDRAGFAEVVDDATIEVAPHLRPLRAHTFNPDADALATAHDDETAERVRLLLAPDRLREVRAVAKEIKRLVLDEGFAPHEIAVVYRDRGRYESIVREVFRDESVAVSLGERRSLTALPAARAAMKVLDAAVANRSKSGREIPVQRLVALLKTDYFSLAPPRDAAAEQGFLPFEDAPAAEDLTLSPDDIENAVAFVGANLTLDDWLRRAERLITRLSGDEHLQRLLEVDKPEEEDPEQQNRKPRRPPRVRMDFPLHTLRRAVGAIDAAGRIVLTIPHDGPAAEIAEAYRGALAALNFESRLLEATREAVRDEGALRRAALDLRAFSGIGHAIDAVVEATTLAAGLPTPRRDAGDSGLTRAEFRTELQRAMEAHDIAVESETAGAVRVVAATDLRGTSYPVVFVLGLVEGEFPARTRGDWIYPQHERENFRSVGLPLEDLSPEDGLRNEEHYFYQVVCRATSRLTLCRPLTADDDSETIASYFIAEIERAAGVPLEIIHTPAGFDGEELLESTTATELARSVVRARVAEAPVPHGFLDALERFARERRPGRTPILSESVSRRTAIEHRRATGGFDEFDGLIASAELRDRLARSYANHEFSPSELNEFGNCGFRFFLKRVLGLTPRVEAALDLQALETGLLLHDTLRRFFELYRGRSILSVAEPQLAQSLRSVADSVFDAFERGMPPLNPRLWRIERRKLVLLLERFLRDEIDVQRRLDETGMAPRYLELAFGLPDADADPHSSPRPLVVHRTEDPTSDAIRLRGQIDRVDASADGHLLAYDYKTSAGPGIWDMRDGRDFQLGVYLEAIETLFAGEGEVVAGGGYYAVKPVFTRRNNGIYRADMQAYTDIGSRCMSSLDPGEWNRLRRQIHDNLWIAYDRVRGGDFRVVPSRNEQTCAYCDYPRVCRFERHRIQIKRRADRIPFGNPLRPIAERSSEPESFE